MHCYIYNIFIYVYNNYYIPDVPASGLYFLTYEALKDYLTDNGKKSITIPGTVFAGGCAGIANWLIGMPFDVLKSRLQTGIFVLFPIINVNTNLKHISCS